MLLFAYRDITAWISRPTPLKWPETPSRVTGGILRPLPKARGETGEHCSSLGRSTSVGTSGDPIGSRTVPAGISASGGHQAFPGGPCTPPIPPFSAVRRTVTIRPTGAYPVQSAMAALRRLRPVDVEDFLCRNLRHHHSRHFRIKPAYAVAANQKISRIENMSPYKIQHRTINLRPLWLD
jgi:hypothetical protein